MDAQRAASQFKNPGFPRAADMVAQAGVSAKGNELN
jgi:hypothetical protein